VALQASPPEKAPLSIGSVAVERSPDGTESLAIQASGPFTPRVFPLKGENPFGSPLRLVVDVKNVASVAGSVSDRDVNGQILERVRTSFVPETRSFRVVLDLAPDTPFQAHRTASADGRFALHLRKLEEEPNRPLQVRAITLRPSKGSREERLLIQADRYFEPVVFGLDQANPYGENARIVVDIPGAQPPAPKQDASIDGGRLVRNVRTHYHARTGKLRVVLDLAPAPAYEVSQAFFEKESLYCLAVIDTAKRPGPRPPAPPEGAGEEEASPEPTPAVVPADLLAMSAPSRKDPGPLRARPAELDEERVRAMFREHGFYSTCGIYNARYCNQEGDFKNRLRECGSGVICDDATGLMWERAGSVHPMTWNEAAAYIRERNRSGAGGRDDWRLPTLEELLSLMERSWGEGGLYVSDLFDGDLRSCWSADTRGDSRAWKVNYHLGYAVDALVEEPNRVRAVRGMVPNSNWAESPPSSTGPAGTPVMARQAVWR
jgi:hypothetical protein